MRMGWSGRGKVVAGRGLVNQRSEPPQPHLLGQTLTLFNYFWSIGFDWLRATIMSPKVCGVVSAHKSIRAGGIDGFDVQTDPR